MVRFNNKDLKGGKDEDVPKSDARNGKRNEERKETKQRNCVFLHR